MATRSHNHHRLNTAWSTHGSTSTSLASSGSRQQYSGQRPSKRNSLAEDRQQRLESPCIGMISPLEDVTDTVLASEYQSLSAPRPKPRSWTTGPHDAVVPICRACEPIVPEKRHVEALPSRRSTKRARWADGGDGPATPPRTPYIGRLESPDLEPIKCSGGFCDCCLDEERYYDAKGKMDHQSRYSNSECERMGFNVVVVLVGDEMTKSC